jgi:superoxide dismutase, Cu-Zn family
MHALRLTLLSLSITTLAVTGLTACSSAPGSGPRASTQLQARSGSSVAGTVWFVTQGDGKVKVEARVSGLNPNQQHAFHVHEKGDCSAPDAMSAGGHFNPMGHPHGAPGQMRHAGDMPALQADASGTATATFTTDGMSVGTGSTDIVGKALIVHAKPDDYTTQPTGNAGGRIACGIITLAN